jgi:hypothetical protein
VGKLGTPKEGHVTVKLFSSLRRLTAACRRNMPHCVKTLHIKTTSSRLAAVSFLLSGSAAVVVLLLISLQAMAQGDSMSKIKGIPKGDSVSTKSAEAPADSLSKNRSEDSLAKAGAPVQEVSVAKNATFGKIDLTNIVLADKKIRASGWGEYRVGGRCICCDNMRSADCITVQTTNRTDKLRIKQIIDGKMEADTGDKASYFGDVYERDVATNPVALLMAEITWNNPRDIYKVIVYFMAEKEKKKGFFPNCELGYTDQFDRLQWAGKVENNKQGDTIAFELGRPIFTKDILLKVKDGRSRITEVAIFAENKKE